MRGSVKCNNRNACIVYEQGDLEKRAGKVIFLTVHDVGSNHRSFMPFVEHKDMSEVFKKSIWLHVCLPGQDDHEETLPTRSDNICSFFSPSNPNPFQLRVSILGQARIRSTLRLGSVQVKEREFMLFARTPCKTIPFCSVRTFIGMGEGAGANILCRFALRFPNRCLGLILIDSTCGTAGFDEFIKYTVSTVITVIQR